MGWEGVEISIMTRAEVETFKIQNTTSCFRYNGCTNCMNEIPCHWYLSFVAFLDILDEFLGLQRSKKNLKFLIIKEGVVTKL